MILRKGCLKLRYNVLNKCILNHAPNISFSLSSQTRWGVLCKQNVPSSKTNQWTYSGLNSIIILHRKWYSNGLLDKDVQDSKDLSKIKELFPEPRMILNNLSAKTPQKIFDVHFKQYVAPKIGKKKIQNLDWTCTYTFVWPEKMKFEYTSLSKRQAADKCANQALHWLYTNKKIDNKGCPVYDKTVLNEIRGSLNEPIVAEISEKSMARIDRVWNDYQNEIRAIYERVAKDAENYEAKEPRVMTKDSTIDEDEISESEDGISEDVEDITDPKVHIHPVYGRVIKPPSSRTVERRKEYLNNLFEEYKKNITPLPMDEYTQQITDSLSTHRSCIIVGYAGCGKSTRVPPSLLEHSPEAQVLVTQPRRVAAVGLAERVASELGEDVGETVGYQVRLQWKPPRPPSGSILYCTSGVLLNRLQRNPGLLGCTHVLIDEAHERDVNTDVTMLLLRRALQVNPELRVMLMSATMDVDVFTRYFDNTPVIEVPGRLYPVEVLYLDGIEKRYNLKLKGTKEMCAREDGRPQISVHEIVDTIKAIDKLGKEGGILVFLPGWAEIKLAKQMLDEHYQDKGLHLILPVHSRLSTLDQSKMFSTPPPGVRKIVLSTNVAETSVTVPDVVHVIDAGVKRDHFCKEGSGTSTLETGWVSRSGAEQRAGRAGRVQPGFCYRMYTKEKEAEFDVHTKPEILRIPLEQTVLDCKSYAPEDKAQDFLSQLPEPPSGKTVQYAVNELIDIGALTKSESLTRLGCLLSSLSVSPRVGLSLVHSVALGTAVSMSNIAVHCDSNVNVFVNAAEERDAIREMKREYSETSDHMSLHCLQQLFEENLSPASQRDEWCRRRQLRPERMMFVKSLSSQYLAQLLKSGLIETNLELDDISRFSDIDELTIGTLLTGVNGILTTKKCVQTKGKLKSVYQVFTSKNEKAHIASESVNHGITRRTNKQSLLAHCGGTQSRERRALCVYKTSLVTPQCVTLFSKGEVVETFCEEKPDTSILYLPKHRLKIHVPTSQAQHILKAREMLWSTLQYHIDRDLHKLDYEDITTAARFKIRLLKTIGKLLMEASNSHKYIEDS